MATDYGQKSLRRELQNLDWMKNIKLQQVALKILTNQNGYLI